MPERVVIKVGGSLLDRPELVLMVRRCIALRPGWGVLIVVGGGTAADAVRAWDRAHGLGEEASHWLALEAMGLNESLVQRLCPELRLVRSGPQFEMAVSDGVPALLCSACFVRWGESNGHVLRHSWDATSDSVAAWAAGIVQAEELILLKSTPLPAGRSAAQAAEAGLVDAEFPALASRLPSVGWINARAGNIGVVPWLSSPMT